MRPIALLERPSRLVVGLGLLAAASPALAQARQPIPAAGCIGLLGQLGMAVGMLVLTAAIHTLVTVLQAELTHRPRLDAWCGARSRRRLLMIVAMALLTALALWVEILLSVAEAVNGMLMAGWSKAQLVYVVQRITLLPLVSEGRLP